MYFRRNSIMAKSDANATAIERIKGMVQIRDCVNELIEKQMDANIPDSEIIKTQAQLNTLYDNYVAKYGILNSRANAMAFSDDSSYYLLCSLETVDEDRQHAEKADMFTKRTIKPHKVVTSVDTASEALALSIGEKAHVDIMYMSELTGKTEQELASELTGVVFKEIADDGSYTYQTADEFLSGNVREKLVRYEDMLGIAEGTDEEPTVQFNMEALKAAQPKDLDASVEVRLGATWIDKNYIKQFIGYL